ncbi:hypothetical protein GCM10027048_29490 [Hymenobacter coalescens]
MTHAYPLAAVGIRRAWLGPGLLWAGLLLAAAPLRAQSVGIGTTTPDSKAALDISSTDKGLLIPRLTQDQRTAMTGVPTGLMVFQTDGAQPGFWYYFGGQWLNLPNSTSGDNLGNHTATQPLTFDNGNGDKVRFESGGPNVSKIAHSTGWSIDMYAGPGVPSGTFLGQHRFFTTAGNGYIERMRLGADGNLGLGLTAPAARLDVNGSVRVVDGLAVDANSLNTGLNDALRLGGLSSGEALASNRLAGNTNRFGLDMYTNGQARLSILNGGNVGIGTQTPGQRLEVSGSAYVNAENSGFIADEGGRRRVGLMKYAGREAGLWRAGNVDFEIGRINTTDLAAANGSNQFVTDLYVAGDGAVGVGTTTPQQRLDVSGSITANNLVLRDFSANKSTLLAIRGSDGRIGQPNTFDLQTNGSVPSGGWAAWIVTHNLGFKPMVMLSMELLTGNTLNSVTYFYKHVNDNQFEVYSYSLGSSGPVEYVIHGLIVR